MDVKIVEKERAQVVGLEIETSLADGKFMSDVNALIEEALTSLVLDRIPNRKYPEIVLGISSDLQEDGSYTFMLAAETEPVTEIPEGTSHREIPAAKYAVVTARGEMPFALIEAHEYLRENWLPNSGYVRATTPSFEVYGEMAWDNENPEIDVYIPINVK